MMRLVVFAVTCIALLRVSSAIGVDSSRQAALNGASTECPHITASASSSAADIDAFAYSAAIERLKSQLFRAFERYGVAASPVNDRSTESEPESSENLETNDILQQISEVLPLETTGSTLSTPDGEQATLYLPLSDRRCGPAESAFAHCFAVDMRGINFNGEKGGSLNFFVRGTARVGNEVLQLTIHEETSSSEPIARASSFPHLNQGAWMKIPVTSNKLKRWRNRDTPTRLVVVARVTAASSTWASALSLDLQNGTTRPYLELAPQKIRSRNRRSVEAAVGGCGMRQLDIPTSSIDPRIIVPAVLKFQFCSGHCSMADLDVSSRLRSLQAAAGGPAYSRCCVASSYTNVTIIWRNEDLSSIIHLNKAIPASCTCM